jgi:DNA-binding XRE family transcriptional regulator
MTSVAAKWVVYAVDWEVQERNSLAFIPEATMFDIKKTFGRNLRAIRKSKGFSQERLAYASGIDRGYVGKIERGEVNLSIEKLYLLAKVIGCSPKDLVPDD